MIIIKRIKLIKIIIKYDGEKIIELELNDSISCSNNSILSSTPRFCLEIVSVSSVFVLTFVVDISLPEPPKSPGVGGGGGGGANINGIKINKIKLAVNINLFFI